jgi:hypothetical protein
VFIADGSLVRFHDNLEADYPSVWTNHMKASGKVHVVMNAVGRIPKRVDRKRRYSSERWQRADQPRKTTRFGLVAFKE